MWFNASGSTAHGADKHDCERQWLHHGRRLHDAIHADLCRLCTLTAGQSYYIEALQKQNDGGDFLQVAWSGPNIASPTIIPGSALSPFNINVAPTYSNIPYSFALRPNSPNGTVVGTVAATDPEGAAMTYAVLSGNSLGAFAINPTTGAITVVNSSAVTPGQTTTLVIGAQDDGIGGVYPLATVTAPVAIVVPKPVDQWRQDHFGANAGNAAIAGNLADPDGDGLVNLLEYALGTDPLVGNANNWSIDEETVGTDKFLRLTVTKNPDATDVTYGAEVTGDLTAGSWSSASVVVETNTTTTFRARDNVPVGTSSARFIRLRVSVP